MEHSPPIAAPPLLKELTLLHAHPSRPFWPRAEQRHPFHELVYVLRGRYVVKTLGVTWQGGPGWLYTYAPEQRHTSRFEASGAARSQGSAILLQWHEPGGQRYPSAHFDASRRIRAVLEWMLDLYSQRAADRAVAGGLIGPFLHELGRVVDHRQSLVPAVDVYLADRPTGPIRVAEMAQALGLSRSHFSRAFRDLAGMTPQRYIMRYRLARAGELLAGTEETLAQVADATGFCSAAHLVRICRQFTGKTPRRWAAARDRTRQANSFARG